MCILYNSVDDMVVLQVTFLHIVIDALFVIKRYWNIEAFTF